jgi:hypothetical protein
MQGAGLDPCQMLHSPGSVWELLHTYTVLSFFAGVAGCLRALRPWPLRAVGMFVLGLLVPFLILVGFTIDHYGGIAADTTCINVVDYRITRAILVGLSAGVLISARLARSTTQRLLGPKPEARGPKPS